MFKIKLISFLLGITVDNYWRLLWKMPGRVEFRYFPRAFLIFCMSVVNSVFARCDSSRLQAPAVRRRDSSQQTPIFILGHWGSGTTYLHKLMGCDPHFNYPNLYQVAFPSTFLCTQASVVKLFAPFFPKVRHWDASRVDPLMPMEDELALAILSLQSPYLAWVYPKQEAYYDRYLTFDNVEAREIKLWQQSLLGLIDKIQCNDTRQVLLKSPPHTARVKTILTCFPHAKFIHINRDPLEIYQATLRLYQQALPYFCLQSRDTQTLQDSILGRYERMYHAYFQDLAQVPENQHCEVAFSDLQQHPLTAMRQLYERLSISGFDQVRDKFEAFIASVDDYREPDPIALSPGTIELIVQRWAGFYQRWGYHID